MKQCYQQIIAAKEQQMQTWQMVPRVARPLIIHVGEDESAAAAPDPDPADDELAAAPDPADDELAAAPDPDPADEVAVAA